MTTTADVLVELWARAEREGVIYIVYRGAISPEEIGVEGWFHPAVPHLMKPQIWLYRAPPPARYDEPDRVTQPLQDCIVLAHEYGHFRSWLESDRGTSSRWRAYFDAAGVRDRQPAELSEEQKRLILEEEGLAWDLGEQALRDLGFTEWAEYGRHRDTGLRAHRTVMGVEPSNAGGE